MELALPTSFRADGSAIAKVIGLALLVISICLLPLFGAKVAAMFAGAGVFSLVVFVLPFPTSLMLFFLYLLLDGALKVISNYHPVLHVGQDLFLLCLVVRVIADPNMRLRDWLHTPFSMLFFLFFCSVILQYLNPFGLGILPSIAGTKVYLSGILLFFLVYHHLHAAYTMKFFAWIVVLGSVESLLALVEYLYFPEAIFSLHPKYRLLAGDRFIGELYRPFGTTSAPGAPSMWVFLCAPFAFFLLTQSKDKKLKLLSLIFFALGIPTLVFCQTRSAMVLFVIMLLVCMCAPTGKWLSKLFLLLALIGVSVLFTAADSVQASMQSAFINMALDPAKAERLNKRLLTLLQKNTYQKSRQGALLKSLELAKEMPLGIGLSRVGAASAIWKNKIESDLNFGKEWSFADNVYRAIFTELGIFGLVSWLILIISLASTLMIRSFRSSVKRRRALLWICGATPLVILLGGWGSEGILYMPVGGFLWATLALGLRESEYV